MARQKCEWCGKLIHVTITGSFGTHDIPSGKRKCKGSDKYPEEYNNA